MAILRQYVIRSRPAVRRSRILSFDATGMPTLASIRCSTDQTNWRVRLDVTISSSAGRVEVQRSTDGGLTWFPVRGDDPSNGAYSLVSGGVATVYDSEIPLDTPAIYRARGVNATTGVTDAWSASCAAQTIVSLVGTSLSCAWVIHPIDRPGKYVVVEVQQDGTQTADAPRGVYYRLGVTDTDGKAPPTVLFGDRRKRASSQGLQILARSNAERANIASVIESDVPLVVRAPAFTGWDQTYIAAGAIAYTHVNPIQAQVWRIQMPWTAVARPTVTPVTVFGSTWADVVARYATWNAVIGAQPSWATLVGMI